MKYSLSLVVCTLVILFASCSPDVAAGWVDDDFFFQSEGARFPIKARGNVASSKCLVILHGGPGDSAYAGFASSQAFKQLENDMLVIYWDQRVAGNSILTSSAPQFDMQLLCRDLDAVIDMVQLKYCSQKIFLLGHSWGGMYGTYYLLDSARQARVAGWIDVDGAENCASSLGLSTQWVQNFANRQLQDPATNIFDRDMWTQALEFYKQPIETTTRLIKHFEYVGKSRGYQYNQTVAASANEYSKFATIHGLLNLYMAYIDTNAYNSPFLDGEYFFKVDLAARMGAITLPSLILWGRHDGILPVPLQDLAYNSLGTAAGDKFRYTFENSAHSPIGEETSLFVEKVLDFVKRY